MISESNTVWTCIHYHSIHGGSRWCWTCTTCARHGWCIETRGDVAYWLVCRKMSETYYIAEKDLQKHVKFYQILSLAHWSQGRCLVVGLVPLLFGFWVCTRRASSYVLEFLENDSSVVWYVWLARPRVHGRVLIVCGVSSDPSYSLIQVCGSQSVLLTPPYR